ncbi:NADH-quinone oxidoreductase subunit C [Thermococcus argininiproducens]|uniref:NADH-quinone oxidoreductase subunit C n=1 Tax=Thermococcus argininiproducens TaxID=2866384 RepID=A0A9E7MBR3_9EURY|nr:NADH-quinone oxidoreductase subunit C [Thermococcus argininiproducens]USH00323.1 NADH-quinone oxidoreductase subunit C [Thermococcus argininiproducens]
MTLEKEENILRQILEKAPYAEGKVRRARRIEFRIPAERIREFLTLLKESNFETMMQITAVDWIKDGEIELVYQMWSYTHAVHAFVKTRIPREVEKAKVPSVKDIYPVAETYERDAHEFYKVYFEGNEKLEMPWILEDEDREAGVCHRKDFDMLNYVKRKYKILDRFEEDKEDYVI